MFSLQPPGSFPLCIDPALQEAAAADLRKVAAAVRDAVRPFPALGLLLIGSVSRGEGTLVPDPEVGSRWLGNLECQLVYRHDGRTAVKEINSILRALEAFISDSPYNRRRGLRVGLYSVADSRLARLRPAIFTCEFLEHAKLLWGDPHAIPQPAWWLAGKREIPLPDAFRLLNNRIVQQVEARLNRELGSGAPLAAEYGLNKFWIELGTSLSVFLGCYQSSYRGRHETLKEILSKRSGPLDQKAARLLLERLNHAMEVKMGRRPSLITSDESFAEAAAMASRVWFWESAQLLGLGEADKDWHSIIPRLKRIESPKQRLRDWIRLLVRPGARRYIKLGMREMATVAALAGSLANAIYGSASMVEFFWGDLTIGNERGSELISAIRELFGICDGGKVNGETRLALAKMLVGAWDRHLRLSPA